MSNKNEDLLSPDVEPNTKIKKDGVRRVNNRPIMIILFVVFCFIAIMGMVAIDRSEKQKVQKNQTEEFARNSSVFANQVAGDKTNGFVPPAIPVSPLKIPDTNKEEGNKETLVNDNAKLKEPIQEKNKLNPPSNNNSNQMAQMDDEALRIKMQKMQLLQSALAGDSKVQFDNIQMQSSGGQVQFNNRTPPETRDEMLSEIDRVKRQMAQNGGGGNYKNTLSKARSIVGSIGQGGQGSGSGGMSLLSASTSSGSANSSWELGNDVDAPRTPYTLRAGAVIPAVLISGINSELSGQILAQVTQDVWDTSTGKFLLFPQGSRLVGSYSNDVLYGQSRVLVAWQRVIFPDGKALDIGSMPGSDESGYAGLNDLVDRHFMRIFGSAFLMSGVTAGITISQDQGNNNNNNNGTRASDALSQALGQQLGNVAVEMIRKNMNIAPTIKIRKGYRLNVMVTKDMVFSKPYESFDY